MSLPPYEPTDWVDKTESNPGTLINQTRMNKIEDQLVVLTDNSGGGEVTDATVAAVLDGPQSTTKMATHITGLTTDSVKRYGAVGNGLVDDSAAVLAAHAANPGRTVHYPAGEYRIDSDTRLVLKSFSAISGDPNGGTTLRFTHASGGISLEDAQGPGSVYVYGPVISHMNISGSGTTNVLVSGTKVEEATFDHVEFHDWLDAAVDLTDANLVNFDACSPALATGTESRIGVRLRGNCGYVRINGMNAYACTPVLLAGSVTNLGIDGWFEGVPDLVRVSSFGVTSIGEISVSGHLVSSLASVRVFNYVTGAGMNIETFDWSDLYVHLPSSTAALIDTSAVDNSAGTVRFRSHGGVVTAPNVANLVAVHASQAWYLFHVDHRGLTGPTPDKWWTATTFVNGGCWPKATETYSVGDPNGVAYAPAGSTFHQQDTGDLWVRRAGGVGNTGWVRISQPVLSINGESPDGAGDVTVDAGGGGISAFPYPPITSFTSNWWASTVQYGNITLSNQNLNASPLPVGHPIRITDFALNVTTAGDGVIHAALYETGPGLGSPHNADKIADFLVGVDISTNGMKSVTGLSVDLQPGLYWVAVMFVGATGPVMTGATTILTDLFVPKRVASRVGALQNAFGQTTLPATMPGWRDGWDTWNTNQNPIWYGLKTAVIP